MLRNPLGQELEVTGREGSFYFVQIPRTASTSISKVLGIRPAQHIPARRLREEVGEEAWEITFSFTFVRHPLDKLKSQYYYRHATNQNGERDISFDEFVQAVLVDKEEPYYNNPVLFWPQYDWISNEEGERLVHYVGKFENLEQDWATICAWLGYANCPPLPREKGVPKIPIEMSHETKWIIRDHFEVDYVTFGYGYKD